jgi:FkbM family methyltransferase
MHELNATGSPWNLEGGCYQLARCRHGLLVCNRNDVFIGRSLLHYGEYSQGEVDFLTGWLKNGDVVVEAGANIGAITVPLAQSVAPGGGVLAYEPQRLAHQILCANLALNGLSNVFTRQAAAGAVAGETGVPDLRPEAVMNYGGVSLGNSPTPGWLPVPVETIDDYALGRCALIKVDVEGMERAVLQGAARTIATLRPLLYVENGEREHSPELLATIRAFGYRLWWHLPPLFQKANFNGRGDDIFGGAVSCNVFCAPREREIDPGLPLPAIARDDEWPEGLA